MSTLHEKICEIIDRKIPVDLFIASVKSVDESEYTCVLVEPGEEDAPHYNVRLKPIIESGEEGVIPVPEIHSWVIAANLGRDRKSTAVLWPGKVKEYIIKTSESSIRVSDKLFAQSKGVSFEMNDLLKLNGDSMGGIVNWPKAVVELTKLSSRVDVIYSALNSAQPSTASGGVPDGGAVLISSVRTSLAAGSIKENWSGLENKKVKHG